jgi:hypothetical protein
LGWDQGLILQKDTGCEGENVRSLIPKYEVELDPKHTELTECHLECFSDSLFQIIHPRLLHPPFCRPHPNRSSVVREDLLGTSRNSKMGGLSEYKRATPVI